MSRRSLLCLVMTIVLVASSVSLAAPKTELLWPEGAPHAKGDAWDHKHQAKNQGSNDKALHEAPLAAAQDFRLPLSRQFILHDTTIFRHLMKGWSRQVIHCFHNHRPMVKES